MNETSDGAPLQPLLGDGSNPVDIIAHPRFAGDGRRGTYVNDVPFQEIDYILMSSQLSAKATADGVERGGCGAASTARFSRTWTPCRPRPTRPRTTLHSGPT